MRFMMALVLGWSGCVAEVDQGWDASDDLPQALPMDAAPPVGAFELALGLDPNSNQRMMAAPIQPGASVYFVATPGLGGTGPCPGVLNGECLSLGNNIRVLGVVTANSDGWAELPLNIPRSLSGGDITAQAVVLQGTRPPLMSEPVTGYVGPSFCTFQYDPMCGFDGVTYGNDCMAAVSGAVVERRGPC
jgi:hypothetical protein